MPQKGITMFQEDIIQDVLFERTKQDEKWGEQNHGCLKWLAILTEEVGEVAETINEIHPATPDCLPRLNRYKELKKELIQTAAVCIAWLECIDRRILVLKGGE